MKCMHCLVEFHPREKDTVLGKDVDGGWAIRQYDCPACKRMNLFLLNADFYSHSPGGYSVGEIIKEIPIRPFGSSRPPCPPEVPVNIADDYKEACSVLTFSTKASAALSRRCLQNLLVNAANATKRDLADQIQEVIDSGKLPSHLVDSIDAVRNTGNFAAHPMKSKNTGEILPVEPEEAEWNLDVLESLFDFYYVQPALVAKKRAALNAKLQEAGKPPMK
jgi:hypothetical protein